MPALREQGAVVHGLPSQSLLLGREGNSLDLPFISDKDAPLARPAVAHRKSSIIQQAKPEPAAALGHSQGSETCPSSG